MAATWHLHIYMLSVTMLVCVGNACVLPVSVRVSVPAETIRTGQVLGSPVQAYNCDTETLKFTSSDDHFSVGREGIVALSDAVVPLTGRTFYVWAQDAGGHKSEMEVTLVREHSAVHKRVARSSKPKRFLKRVKRVWRPPPFNVRENDIGTFPKDMDYIGSNSAQNFTVYYTANGPGVTTDPAGLLSVDRNGLLKIHRTIDREEYKEIQFTARVYDVNTHRETDLPLIVTVIVGDENDNAPVFEGPLLFTVLEKSKTGMAVGMVNATDRDEEETLHTNISYTLLTGQDLFAIDSTSGLITVKNDQLDREAQVKHLVTVQIKDMGGTTNGLFNTGTATITLGDINDNAPTFTKTSYEATVDENTSDKLILRIPVEDKDLKNTPNWKSVFEITEGNENGNFRMETDPKTNDGLLYLVKPLDYEKTKSLKLNIRAQNQAKLVGTKGTWLSVPVTVNVADVDEGPQFTAPVIRFSVKENTPNGTLIGKYTAVDPESGVSSGIKYYKVLDPASWVHVDLDSGTLKVANTIDRESPVLQDGIYNVTMKAVDSTMKSATGTVIILVEDENDHVPDLPNIDMILCEKDGQLGSVEVNAVDADQSPFSGPFNFETLKDNDGNWELTRLNETAATLHQLKDLPVAVYQVPMMVTDLQGHGELQTVKVKICQCRKGVCVAKDTTIGLGPLGILALLLPLLFLLLLGVLLALFCATKHEKMQMEDIGDSGGILLKSNIEVPGEEVVDSKLIMGPMFGMDHTSGSVKGSMLNVGWVGNQSSSTMGGAGDVRQGLVQGLAQNNFTQTQYSANQYGTGQFDQYGTGQFDQYGTGQFEQYGTGRFGQYEEGQHVGTMNNNMTASSGHLFRDESTMTHTWQTNDRYLRQKLNYMERDQDTCYAEDAAHSYGFEGVGSAAGSVGCCSDFGQQDDLDFLNTLGPKFKTLAQACRKK